MNVAELKQKLEEAGVPEFYYQFDDDQDYYSTFVIKQEFPSGKWVTLFCDRSWRGYIKRFDTEEEACEYFFNWVYAVYEKDKPYMRHTQPPKQKRRWWPW